jgi:hypothetical protein
MNSNYFRQRLDDSKKRIEELENRKPVISEQQVITKKKRSYYEAFGYENDYECVQEPSKEYTSVIYTNQNILWKDAYTENLLETTSST